MVQQRPMIAFGVIQAAERCHRHTVEVLLKAAPECKDMKDLKGRVAADLTSSPDIKMLLG